MAAVAHRKARRNCGLVVGGRRQRMLFVATRAVGRYLGALMGVCGLVVEINVGLNLVAELVRPVFRFLLQGFEGTVALQAVLRGHGRVRGSREDECGEKEGALGDRGNAHEFLHLGIGYARSCSNEIKGGRGSREGRGSPRPVGDQSLAKVLPRT